MIPYVLDTRITSLLAKPFNQPALSFRIEVFLFTMLHIRTVADYLQWILRNIGKDFVYDNHVQVRVCYLIITYMKYFLISKEHILYTYIQFLLSSVLAKSCKMKKTAISCFWRWWNVRFRKNLRFLKAFFYIYGL